MSLDSLERVGKRKEDERGVEEEGVMMIPERIRDTRAPLQEYTNVREVLGVFEGNVIKKRIKGQWKMRARMQSDTILSIDLHKKLELEDEGKKRDKLNQREDTSILMIIHPGKKWKQCSLDTEMKHFEVEEINRDLSQSYK